MPDETHPCPIARCVVRVAYHQLMCRKHWNMVSHEHQRAVYGTWRDGEGAGSEEHTAAMREAVDAVNMKLAER